MRPDHATAQAHFASLDHGDGIPQNGPIWHGTIDNCDVCSRPMDTETYMIDGRCRAVSGGPWANMCVVCAYKTSPNIGCGIGQLYRREESRWCLVAGGPPDEDQFEY